MQVKTIFSKKEHTDSGLALLLIILIAGLWFKQKSAAEMALVLVLVLLIVPGIVYPFTFLWLNISDFLGRVMSKIILTIIFFVIVCPVAFIRKAMNKDTLRLKKFKKDRESVFTERNHSFTKSDFTTPY